MRSRSLNKKIIKQILKEISETLVLEKDENRLKITRFL